MSSCQSNCFVPRCSTGYKQWQRNIPRADKPLEKNAAVYELHFNQQFIYRHFEHIIDSEVVRLDRASPVLLLHAVPTIFPNTPFDDSKCVAQKRNTKEIVPAPRL
ncbi:hypothetical protein HPB49_003830 [Dermacentor silvarum]|uniref:Uncharacterized protein n=1 Tax=Dermacentor silvarum TaxID=543639 RepID=A0ACB8DUD1_DERSI|nr:hypothetical protein HPB49_003830 [Dermacentor silvarum]